MAMMMQQEPAPKRQTLELAQITARIPLPKSSSEYVEYIGDQYFGLFADELPTKTANHQFTVGEFEVAVERLEVELESIRSGSVLVTLSVLGAATFAVYNGISRYSNFKQGIKEICEDLQRVNEAVSGRLAQLGPIKLSVVTRDEQGLLEEIEQKKFR